MLLRAAIAGALALLTFTGPAWAKTVNYELVIDQTMLSSAGNPAMAMTIEGGIPGPTIRAKIGDFLQVKFTNRMPVETSVHWHGILLPPDQDGVPHLNTRAIGPGESFTFGFEVLHAGTYWYHSHSGLQEQRGVYGAIVFEPHHEHHQSDHDEVVVLSDWNDEAPEKIMRNLKRDGDYYALKKDAVQSWAKVIAGGRDAIRQRLSSAWQRMDPMDLSDVGYDAFLANGQRQAHLHMAKPGEIVRLRLINAGASTFFDVAYAGGPMTIISADGLPVEPRQVSKFRMAIAETYDVLVKVPAHGAYELRASSIDGTGHTSVLIGHGKPQLLSGQLEDGERKAMPAMMGHEHHKKPVPPMPMHVGHNMQGSGHGHHSMANRAQDVDFMDHYQGLQSPASTVYETEAREVVLNLSGNMERYIWAMNDKPLSISDKIMIRRGEVVRFVMVNDTMMNHPMHLHGHFFRVLNGAGERSPLKHTVNVPPMSTVTIEFEANETRDWFFHCHMLYHMATGMAAVVSYEKTSQATDKTQVAISKDRHWYSFADIGVQSNKLQARLWSVNSHGEASIEGDYDWKDDYEVEARYSHFLGRYAELSVGLKAEGHHDEKEEQVGLIGLRYVLPMNIEAELEVHTDGHVLFELGSELQLTDRTSLEWHWNSDNEYELGLSYALSKAISLTASHGNRFGTGAGLMLSF